MYGFYKNSLLSNNIVYTEDEDWCYITKQNLTIDQGWKIHISIQLKDYKKIFRILLPFLIKHQYCFKVCKNIHRLKKINSPREISPTANKFITIYNYLQSKQITDEKNPTGNFSMF